MVSCVSQWTSIFLYVKCPLSSSVVASAVGEIRRLPKEPQAWAVQERDTCQLFTVKIKCNESLWVMALFIILLIPLGEFSLCLHKVRRRRGCGALFKAIWARQTSANTQMLRLVSHVVQGQFLWLQGHSEEPESLMWLSSSPWSVFSECCHWSLLRS